MPDAGFIQVCVLHAACCMLPAGRSNPLRGRNELAHTAGIGLDHRAKLIGRDVCPKCGPARLQKRSRSQRPNDNRIEPEIVDDRRHDGDIPVIVPCNRYGFPIQRIVRLRAIFEVVIAHMIERLHDASVQQRVLDDLAAGDVPGS